MIEVRALRKAYAVDSGGPPAAVLDGVDLAVASGELVAVVGPSGCGKSTLLNVIGGLDGGWEGEVAVDGVRLDGLADSALAAFRNRAVGFVFQSFNLLAPLTATENVMLPSFFNRNGAGERALRARAMEELDRVGLADKANRRPGELSGGERQRVAIARAFFGRPRLLLCDEPTGNLDARTGAEVVELLVRRVREQGVAVLVVTHEDRVCRAADRVLQLREGRLWPAQVAEAAR